MLALALWIIALLVVIFLYAVLRPTLRESRPLKPLYDRLEPVERVLWQRSRTILLARLVWIPGALLSLYDVVLPAFGVGDWTPVSDALLNSAGVPQQFHAAAVIAFTTVLSRGFESLRKASNGPVGAS